MKIFMTSKCTTDPFIALHWCFNRVKSDKGVKKCTWFNQCASRPAARNCLGVCRQIRQLFCRRYYCTMITTFFLFVISISDHQMMDFKEKNHYKSVELTTMLVLYVWLTESMLCNIFLFLRQSLYQYFYMIREQKTKRSILWRSEVVSCSITLCSCDLRT